MRGAAATERRDSSLHPAHQSVIPVLAGHRAGGALVARLLNLMGVELGWPLKLADEENPRGSWEHGLFNTVNERLLEAIGLPSDGMARPEILAAFAQRVTTLQLSDEDREDLAARLARNFMQPVWSWKDPRTALAWPFWNRLLGDLGYRAVRPVVVARHPDACFEGQSRGGGLRPMGGLQGLSARDFSNSLWWATSQILLASELDAEQTLIVWLEDLLDPETAPGEVARLASPVGAGQGSAQRALEWIEWSSSKRLETPSDPNLRALWEGMQALAAVQRDAFLKSTPSLPVVHRESRGSEPKSKNAEYCIFQVSPVGYPHSHAFDEVAQALHFGFAELGRTAPIVHRVEDLQGTPIVVGANLLGRFSDTKSVVEALPAGTILYNLEQIDTESDWLTEEYLSLLRRFRVWDYSPANANRLRDLGVLVEGVCGIGYVPELSRIDQSVEEDIDVLFYGGLNPRRQKILDELKGRGLNVVVAVNCFGETRDQLVGRAKLVLNIHYYEAKVLEMVRISYLLANGQCVVSEVGEDRHEESVFSEAIAFSSYEGLVERCVELVADPQLVRLWSARKGPVLCDASG